ncbi:MAG: prepilin-type N-terminal cleavage/methylation domain-containing protein [Bacillota bacterium]
MLSIDKQNGMTLIEIMVALSILGLVLTAIYSFYLSGLSGWYRSTGQMEYQQTARIAMDKMIRELRFAHSINFNDQGKCYSESGDEFAFNHHYEIICFKTKKESSDSDLTLYRFRLAGEDESDQLFFEQRTDNNNHYATNLVAKNVTALEFIVAEDTEIISITVSAGKDEKKYTLTGSVRPRNLALKEE